MKKSLYEVGPVLAGNHVYEPCLKRKATKYSSRKSHVSKRPENVHMSGITLSLRTQCFVIYWTKSKQGGSTGLEDSNPRHTFNLSLRKQCGQALDFVTRLLFHTRVEDWLGLQFFLVHLGQRRGSILRDIVNLPFHKFSKPLLLH